MIPFSRLPIALPSLLLLALTALGSCQTGSAVQEERSTPQEGRAAVPESDQGTAPPPSDDVAQLMAAVSREAASQEWESLAGRVDPRVKEDLSATGMPAKDIAYMLLGPGYTPPGAKPPPLPPGPLVPEGIESIQWLAGTGAPPADGDGPPPFIEGTIQFTDVPGKVPCRVHLIRRDGRLYLTLPDWQDPSSPRRNS